MTPATQASTPAPAAPDCRVIELRQYTLHPGQRDTLIELFEREFVDGQEAVGIRVLGQFRDLDDADRFVWLRGFADMAARGDALPAFYGGPVWAAHRNAANATMVDSDNVLLLRPAWDGAALSAPTEARAERGATALPPGVLSASVFHLKEAAGPDLLALCRGAVTELLQAAGARVLGWYVTEATPNNFPRLPVREGETVLLGLAMFDNAEALAAFSASGAWQRDIEPLLQSWLAKPTQRLRLSPTSRSSLHA
ncbi:MAG: NIPSNAP family protein [Burkholderiales bacterium]|nr:NIPSNAP family protein [Burkholderiales bacterium]